MSDLIERQAAINAVHEEFDDCLVWDESGQRTADEFEIIINRLPSAQPTVEAIPIKWVETKISEKILMLNRDTWDDIENGIDKNILLKAWYTLIKEWEKENES